MPSFSTQILSTLTTALLPFFLLPFFISYILIIQEVMQKCLSLLFRVSQLFPFTQNPFNKYFLSCSQRYGL